jgi:hypothetical protein
MYQIKMFLSKMLRNISTYQFILLRGKRGIRTPGTVTRSPHFECGPFDHSGIFPFRCAKLQIVFENNVVMGNNFKELLF